jgi:hypothetical protein
MLIYLFIYFQYVYHTVGIEGNTMDLAQTRSILETKLGKKSQCFSQRSGSGLDPDSVKSVDSDPDRESGSRSRRAEMTHKSRNLF